VIFIIRDRFLTVVNVWGNCIATDTIYNLHLEIKKDNDYKLIDEYDR
jgi:hypothetical protein